MCIHIPQYVYAYIAVVPAIPPKLSRSSRQLKPKQKELVHLRSELNVVYITHGVNNVYNVVIEIIVCVACTVKALCALHTLCTLHTKTYPLCTL